MTAICRAIFVVVLIVAPLLAMQQAEAGRVWPVFGANGDVGATPQCGPGKVLVGFSGRAGLWIDQIGIVCADLQSNNMPGRHLPVSEFFGGDGGGPTSGSCPPNTRISDAQIYVTADFKKVHSIVLDCIDANGKITETGFGSRSNDAASSHTGASGIKRQLCPQEQFTGITVRYGKHVNGVGFICNAVNPAGRR